MWALIEHNNGEYKLKDRRNMNNLKQDLERKAYDFLDKDDTVFNVVDDDRFHYQAVLYTDVCELIDFLLDNILLDEIN